MQSKPKANSIVTSEWNVENKVLTFTVLNTGACTLDLKKVHANNREHAEYHGWNQAIPDSAAIGLADKAGNIIPKAERARMKLERMQEKCLHYESGTPDWSRKAPGGGFDGALVLAAIMRGFKWDEKAAERNIEAIRLKRQLGDRTETLKYLQNGETVQRAMLEIKSERIKPVVDADADLNEMSAEEIDAPESTS